MTQTFHDYFRCPQDLASFAIKGTPGQQPSFFHFGADLVCYGQTSLSDGDAGANPSRRDWQELMEIAGQTVYLPFDVDEVANNLRNESFTGHMRDDLTRLGANPMIRSIYYWTRPILPVPVRSVLQRIKLRGEPKNRFPKWPVDRTVDRLFEKLMVAAIRANGGRPIPFIWFWPNGKKAAFILTHDIEDEAGKTFCSSLMDIDDEYGFKASFQIVPESRYPIEPEFLKEFRNRDFEICVHDLNHDGNLYRERSEFRRRAQLINKYCKEFGTEGFRSGVLYRNLLWYGDYQFSYDMSVPNVAHLDPQGGGCCTVMPYFVGDILEIPVTMTQDYALFHILHERSIDLWKQQFRIVAEGHGLISVIIHPDYVIEPREQRMFRDFLSYVREQCATSNIWAAVPSRINSWWRQRNEMELTCSSAGWQITGHGSEVARVAYACLSGDSLVYSFTPPAELIASLSTADNGATLPLAARPIPAGHSSCKESILDVPSSKSAPSSADQSETTGVLPNDPHTQSARRPLRVAMVSYSFYETDNRVLRYASTLAKRGDHVDVFALHREGKPAKELLQGVHVHRLQSRILNEKNLLSYAWRICQFLARATLQVAKYDIKKHYDLLHIHSVPDFMVFSALLPKLRGAPVILDIHDILPEFYASKFTSGKQSGLFHFLIGVERASSRFATHVIIANDIWRERLISRTLTSDKCTVVLNSPDRSIFSRTGEGHPQNGKFLMLYPGSLHWHQGLDIAIRAFAKISKNAPQAEFHIYGDGPSKPELLDLARELGVEHQVKMPSVRSLQEIAQVMETASLGVVPKRKDGFGNEAFSTKIMEFMAMGVPVVVPDTDIDRYYYDDSVVRFFRAGDAEDLARAMLDLIESPQKRKALVDNASRFIEENDWNAKQHEYLELVERLTVNSEA